MKLRALATAVLLGTVAPLVSCASPPLGDDSFAYPAAQDADAFITIPAGAETGTLTVEMPPGVGVYLTRQHLIVEGKGAIELTFGDAAGGVQAGALVGVDGAAFYTAAEPGTFQVTARRGNGGDRAGPLVVEIVVRECNSMVAAAGTCKPS